MTNNQDLTELVVLEDVLSALLRNLESGGGDNRGAQFKINQTKQWAGTIGLRVNHVQTTALPRYLGTVVHNLTAARRIEFWEHTSIARAWPIDRLNCRKRSVPNLRNLYFTFRPSDELYQRLRKKWPEDRFMPLADLVAFVRVLQMEDK